MKKIFIILNVIIFIFLSSYNLFSEETNTSDWLERVELSWQLETDKKPTFYFQTVQPLYYNADKSDTIFIQPRASFRADDMTYNLGLGYRKLASDKLLLGANIFGDYADLHEHGRIGVGLEALGQIFEARFNSYFGVTSNRVVERVGNSITYENVVDGLDYEFGMPIPYAPWLKIYGSGFWYDFKKFDNKHGWKSRLEASINENIRLEFYTWDDNKGDREYGGRLRCDVSFDNFADFKEAFKFSDEPFPKKDLSKQRLIPVERDFEITVEKWTDSAGLIVEVGRS